MSRNILCIDTALSTCSVAIFDGTDLSGYAENITPNAAAEQINVLIEEVLVQSSLKLKNMQAVALSNGPGSYTGLRIGAATAKGIAYTFNIPVIGISTLEIIVAKITVENDVSDCLIIPNIDARRDEAYIAIYNDKAAEQLKAQPFILNDDFLDLLRKADNKYIFAGNASSKIRDFLQQKIPDNQYQFHQDFRYTAKDMAVLANQKYNMSDFEDVAYFEPDYTKPFFIKIKNKIGI